MEAFEERAAIIEFDGGLSRFEAETLAAKAQGLSRWQALEAVRNAERMGNSQSARDHGQTAQRHGSNDLSAMQPTQAEQGRGVPKRDIQTGRGGVEMLALRMERGRVA